MKVVTKALKRQTLEAFADEHGLVMETRERSRQHSIGEWCESLRWYAMFAHAELKEGGMLRGEIGNGDTQQAAIADYGNRISEKLLVIDAYGPNRREIRVPVIVEEV